MQLQATSPGGSLMAWAFPSPAVKKARGLRAKMDRMALVRAPSGPLSSIVFLQSTQLQVLGSQRRPALKQSQYRATHLDLGQLHPDGFSWSGPISRQADTSRSSRSKPLGRLRGPSSADGGRLPAVLLKLLVRKELAVG